MILTDEQQIAYTRARDAFIALSHARAEHESVCKVAQRAADRVLVARKEYTEALTALEGFFVPQYDATPEYAEAVTPAQVMSSLASSFNGRPACGKPIAGPPSIPCVLPEGHKGDCR